MAASADPGSVPGASTPGASARPGCVEGAASTGGRAQLLASERALFEARTPRSRSAYERAGRSMYGGVPMPWMLEWPNPYPLYARTARGNRIWDVDGNEYIDFCLGDTGSMFGHSPDVVVDAVTTQIPNGITTMLASTDAAVVGELLTRRFGLPYWQLAMSATDANRFVVRLSRVLTDRPKVLVFNGCYHGSLDEALVGLDAEGRLVKRAPTDTNPAWIAERGAVVVEFNDLAALDRALARRDVACVLAEPIMTNCGMVLPEPGYHDALRALTREHGTYLVIDETHTLSCGYGGYTREHGLEPDFLVFGKAIAGGIPIAGYGFSADVEGAHRRMFGDGTARIWGEMGIGGTLSGNAYSVAVLRAALERLATPEAFDHMIRLGEQMADRLESVIRESGLGWSVTSAGARVEIQFTPDSPSTGGAALAAFDWDLVELSHLYLLNRGIVITPFHNMMLVSPATSEEDIETLAAGWAECMNALALATQEP